MKKILLSFALSLIFLTGYCQKFTLMNNVAATTTVTAYTADVSPQVGQMGNGWSGNLHIVTSSAFNGTTSTDSVFVSLNGTDWAILKDDSGTPVAWTLSAGYKIYTLKIKSAMESFIKIKYDKGNATLGTQKAILFLR